MKIQHLSIACVALLLTSGLAKAGDGYLPERSRDCYVKGSAVGSFISHDLTLGANGLPLGTAGFGAAIGGGCDLIWNQFVLGAFADYTFLKKDTAITSGGLATTLPFGNEWTVGARAGVFVKGALVYGLAGYTVADARSLAMPGGPTYAFSGPRGMTLGGGLEIDLGNRWTAGLEYRHTGFDSTATGLAPIKIDTIENSVRAGVALHF